MRIMLLASLLMSGCSIVLASVASAQDTECDCRETHGRCTADYRLYNVVNDPQKINSKAELEIRSSAAQCSKVSFRVDNTPYISVLKNTNTAQESLFGTMQFNSQTISIESCELCTIKQTNAQQHSSRPSTRSSTADQMFGEALDNKDFDAARYNQQLGQSQQGDSGNLDIGTTLQIINIVQGAAANRATQTAAGAAAAATTGAGNNTRYENHGGLQPYSAPLPTKSDSTTKSSGCATCGVR